MIRFPERSHASNTPAVARIEPNYQETPRRETDGRYQGDNRESARPRDRFDFTAINAVLGR